MCTFSARLLQATRCWQALKGIELNYYCILPSCEKSSTQDPKLRIKCVYYLCGRLIMFYLFAPIVTYATSVIGGTTYLVLFLAMVHRTKFSD
jgi:hypothetical protein